VIEVLLYSLIAAIILAGIDTARRKYRWLQTKNLEHAVSGTFAVVLGAGVYLALYHWHFGWMTLIFASVFTCCRGLLYDGFINLFNRDPFSHVSFTTSAQTDQRLNRLTFWQRRAIYAGALVITLLLNYFL